MNNRENTKINDSGARTCDTSMQNSCRTIAVLVAAVIYAAEPDDVKGQCAPQVAAEFDDVVVNNLGTGDQFGNAVAVDGDTAVVGAYRDNRETGTPLTDAGSISPFVRSGNTWVRQGSIRFASNASANAFFGWDVDIYGDRIVACDYFSKVYVHTRVTGVWTETAILTFNQASGPLYGLSVAIYGDTIVVGAPYDNELWSGVGAMYVFVYNGMSWVQQAKLRPSDAAEFSFQFMGASVAIDGDTAIAGAPSRNAAYVFVRNGTTWTQQAKLVPQDADGSGFGASVAIHGNRALAGAPFDSTGGGNAGAAYFLSRSGMIWSQQKVANTFADDKFGNAVDLYGDTAIVGAYHDAHSSVANAGSAHILVRGPGGWSIQASLYESFDVDANDEFGTGVALHGDTALVGAPGDNWTNLVGTTSNDVGAATFYDLRCEGACCVNGHCTRLSVGDCNVLGGAFQGLGTNCIGVTCAPAVCRGDFNADRSIDGADVQGFVNALLQGEICP